MAGSRTQASGPRQHHLPPTPAPPSRSPLAVGVAGGVGTTTVATALGLVDRGVFTGRTADVLVCRSTGDSLHRAARAAQLVAADGHGLPLLAVTCADTSGPSRPTIARLRLLEPHASAVVVLPYVRRWHDLAAPLDEVRDLLTRPAGELPRALRPYAAALTRLSTALADHPRSGNAARARPAATRPRTAIARPVPGRISPSCTP